MPCCACATLLVLVLVLVLKLAPRSSTVGLIHSTGHAQAAVTRLVVDGFADKLHFLCEMGFEQELCLNALVIGEYDLTKAVELLVNLNENNFEKAGAIDGDRDDDEHLEERTPPVRKPWASCPT
jgi:hypothetical protein